MQPGLVVGAVVRSPRCHSPGVLPLVGLRGGMPRTIAVGAVCYCLLQAVQLRVSSLIPIPVGFVADRWLASWSNVYLPRVESRIATVSRVTRSRYHRVLISVGLRLLDTLEIGGGGLCDSRRSDPVHHDENHAVPRPRYRIRIRSPLKSMV